MSDSSFKRLKKFQIKNLRKEIIKCCLIYRDVPEFDKINSNKFSQNVFETESSGALLKQMIDAIERAEDIICVSTFLINERSLTDAMLNATSRGVRVYILTSELNIESESEDDDEISQKNREEHLKLLDEIAGKILVRTANHFHSKFLIIDPNTYDNSIGFLLTANLKNKALFGNGEIGIILRGAAVYELYEQFCYGFWKESEHELLEPGRLRDVIRKSHIQLPELFTISYTTNETTKLKQEIISLITNSIGELIISSFGFEEDYEITNLILNEIRNDRRVIILAPNRPKIMNTLKRFREEGAEVLIREYHHAKAILVKTNEYKEGLIFTANLTSEGLENGFESGIKVYKEDTLELEKILLNWYQNFPLILKVNVNVGDILGKILFFENYNLIEKEIKPTIIKNLGEIQAESIYDMESTEPLNFPELDSDEICHEIRYEWTVIPPILPKDAKKIKNDSELPFFEWKRQKFILITNKSELKTAEELAPKNKAKIVVDYKKIL